MNTTPDMDTPTTAREHMSFVERTPCYCIRLRRAAAAVTDFYDQMFSPFGVSVNQFSILVNLTRYEACGTGELARHLGLEKSTLVRSLQPLIRANLVEDTAPERSRAHQWRLSAEGKALVESAMPVWEKAQAGIRTALEGKQRELFDILERLDSLAACGKE